VHSSQAIMSEVGCQQLCQFMLLLRKLKLNVTKPQ